MRNSVITSNMWANSNTPTGFAAAIRNQPQGPTTSQPESIAADSSGLEQQEHINAEPDNGCYRQWIAHLRRDTTRAPLTPFLSRPDFTTAMQIDSPPSQHDTRPLGVRLPGSYHQGGMGPKFNPKVLEFRSSPKPQRIQTAARWWKHNFPAFQQIPGWKAVLAQAARHHLLQLTASTDGKTSSLWDLAINTAHQPCNEEIEKLTRERDHAEAKAKTYFQELKNTCDVYEKVKAENEAFREQIFAISTGRGPLHEESYYIQKFESVKNLIQQGALKLCRVQGNETLSSDREKAVLKALGRMGEYGGSAFGMFNETEYTLPLLYENKTWRIALIRHIIAVFLMERVFSPFVFGVGKELSDGLKYIQNDIIEHESQLSSVLMIHQALGRGVLRFRPDLPERRHIVAFDLHNLLQILLSLDPNKQLSSFVTKVINAAVDLKMAVGEEQEIYRVFWRKYDDPYEEDWMEAPEEDEPAGPILVCTFPGLARWHRNEKKDEMIPVVKAFTFLKQTFEDHVS